MYTQSPCAGTGKFGVAASNSRLIDRLIHNATNPDPRSALLCQERRYAGRTEDPDAIGKCHGNIGDISDLEFSCKSQISTLMVSMFNG